MSQENVKIVQRWIDVFPNDADAFRELLHPEIEWRPFEDNHTPSYGIEGGMRIRTHWLESWDEMRGDLEEIRHEGESVLATLHVTGRGKASGVNVDVRLYLHFKVRDGRVLYLFEYADKHAALEAIGLSE